jgi:hypothetical protein
MDQRARVKNFSLGLFFAWKNGDRTTKCSSPENFRPRGRNAANRPVIVASGQTLRTT